MSAKSAKRVVSRAASAFSLDNLERREMLAFTAHVNFQPSESSAPSGYVEDSGHTYQSQSGLTFGWSALHSGDGRDRNMSTDQRYDTLRMFHSTDKWEISVPNGTYSVHIVSGDPAYTNSIYQLNAEGKQVVNGTPSSSNHYVSGTATITVSDGRLTVTNGSGSMNNKISFIDITGDSTTSSPAMPPASPTGLNASAQSSSSIKLTWSDNSSRESGYKIERSTNGSTYSQIASVGANSTSWTNSGLSSNTTYYYRVRAYNGYGNSSSSSDNAKTFSSTSNTPTPSTSDSYLGVKGLVIGGGSDPSKKIPILKDVGARTVRIWCGIDNWGQRWDANPVYSNAAQYHNAGLKVVLLLTCNKTATYDQAKSYFNYMLNRPGLKNAVDFWEIQNEEDLQKYYDGYSNLSGYVNNNLRAAWDVFHANGEKVIGGAPIFTASLTKLMNAGYTKYCDYAGFHFYGGNPQTIIDRLHQVHTMLAGKPLAVTEWGLQFVTYGGSTWANYINQVAPVMKSQAVFSQYYSLMVANNDSNGGLVYSNYTHNSALYNAFKSWN